MDYMEPQNDMDAPGGLLLLKANGTILHAPTFFRRALYLDNREVPSFFHLCDPSDPPYLSLHRIFRHPYGATEYHLRVQGPFGSSKGFRYWPLEQSNKPGSDQVAFYIVDDSAILQHHDWDYRRLRREILNDVKESLSNHFKTRLATLQLLAETLRDAPEIAAESAPRIMGAVEQLKKSVNQVMTGLDDIESPTDYQDSPVRLTDLAGVVGTWGNSGVSVRCEVNGVSPSTLIPASSIERIVLPIVENAVEASPKGSTVDVIIDEVDDRFAHFKIIDQGVGMSERVKERAGDPFFSTRTSHLGLGLAHAREAIRDAGGEWNIESKSRQGTEVTLLLPITTAAHLFR
jgi:signal transduction histidine kinase